MRMAVAAASRHILRILELEARRRRRLLEIHRHILQQEAALRRQEELHPIDFVNRLAGSRFIGDLEFSGQAGAAARGDRKTKTTGRATVKAQHALNEFFGSGSNCKIETGHDHAAGG